MSEPVYLNAHVVRVDGPCKRCALGALNECATMLEALGIPLHTEECCIQIIPIKEKPNG